MKETTYHVKLRFTENLLGSTSKQKDIYAKFIASKAKDAELGAEEVEDVKEAEERGWTGFLEDKDGPYLSNHAIKGFLNESARRHKQFGLLKQLQDKFKGYVFVTPRKIRLPAICSEPLERSCRCTGPMGPRTFLARSDQIAEGTEIEFDLHVGEPSGIKKPCLKEVLSYGLRQGIGQFRTGGYGTFKVVQLKEIDDKTEA